MKYLHAFFNRKIQQLAIIGFLIGLIFPVGVLIIDASQRAQGFSNIPTLYRESAVHSVMLLIPVLLSVIFTIIGKLMQRQQKETQVLNLENQKQWNLLQNFIHSLNEGNLNATVSDEFHNKEMGSLLANYKHRLIEQRSSEEKRNWESEGLAQFGDLLRSAKSLNELSDAVMRFAVKYTGSNQGSVFLLNDTDTKNPVLELAACYAYDRKKFISQTVEPGQGLIGQCYLEAESIILTDVPENFVRITSGLGEATPRFIAIVPMKAEDSIQGIIEIASFKVLEPYQITFLEKIAEAFATTLRSLRTNENIKILLEESQQQTEEMRAQEEEMRQNMEEIQAIQEQIAHQLEENIVLKNLSETRERVLSLTTILSETDLYGTITYINSKFCEVSQYSEAELLGKPHNMVRHPDMPREIFKLLWTTIKRGEVFNGIVKNRKKDGTHYWVDATIVPIMEEGKIVKYIGARYHIEDDEIAETLYARQLEMLGLMAELDSSK